ncbi:hypothetical protein ACSHWB_38325 [Lentzea sp. HUAS TT2]|uniref:hypothetical protein n=1 Tax=Lentzea sp. HUAS TT2 TaxID=3447454 RepID=UPI003F6E96B1
MQFDTRAQILTTEIGADWDPLVRQQWLENRHQLRAGLIHEFGNHDHERKIADFVSIKAAPWSIIDEHNAFLQQIRNCFTHGSYYPALVGACALGERILNALVIRLRGDFAGHPATVQVENQATVSDWVKCIVALFEWGVIGDPTATQFNTLRKLRNRSIHYGTHLSGSDARDDALNAVLLIQGCIETLFSPFGTPPRFIAGTPGVSFISLVGEQEPLVKRFFLPNCALVSPNFEMRPAPGDEFAFQVFDDGGYQEEYYTLTDEEFSQHYNVPVRVRSQE